MSMVNASHFVAQFRDGSLWFEEIHPWSDTAVYYFLCHVNTIQFPALKNGTEYKS